MYLECSNHQPTILIIIRNLKINNHDTYKEKSDIENYWIITDKLIFNKEVYKLSSICVKNSDALSKSRNIFYWFLYNVIVNKNVIKSNVGVVSVYY